MNTLEIQKRLLALVPAALLLAGCGYAPGMPGAYGQNPYATGPYGQAPSGYGQNPYDQTGYDQTGYDQTGYGQNGFESTGYEQTGYEQTGYEQTGYEQTGYGPTGMDQNGYPQSGYGNPGSSWQNVPGSNPGSGSTAYPPAGSGWQNMPGTSPAAGPTPSPSPQDRAPDPIPPASYDQVSEDLSVLTYNVWGLPGLLGTKRKERFERLGATLNAYDVVTLQEAYSDDIEILKQSTGFIHHARIDNASLLKTGSGLYTLSKYPILKTEFVEFNHCTGTDCLTRKGILLTRIDHPKIGPVDVYTTSYQAGDTARAKEIRTQDDNRQLQEMIQRNRSTFPVIITGDFDFVPEQSEYKDLLTRMQLVDVFPKLHPNEGGYTSTPDNPNLKGEGVPMRLDYIFLLKKDGVTITPLTASLTHTAPIDNFVLSDHYGVSAKLRIRVSK
ncbi:MAG: endonuclease/exonuclease/phosphatase family protein [Candidatus Sericytochromatia bacterium]